MRLDGSAYRRSFVSPRAALIYQPSINWTYKFLYGRSFRNPTAFSISSTRTESWAWPIRTRRPEKVDTIEVDVERKIGKRLNLVTAAYGYRLAISWRACIPPRGLAQTQNTGQIHAKGFEIELQARPRGGWKRRAATRIQAADTDAANLPNSPHHLAKLHFAVPLGRKFDVSSGMQYFSSRETLAGASLKPVFLADFTVSSTKLLPNFDVRAGLRNAFNRNYSDPVALNSGVDSMQQPGRTFFVELIVHGGR